MKRQRAIVICPGRGVYNASELGYLKNHHADKSQLIAGFDAIRQNSRQTLLSDLDGAEKYSVSKFTRGDNASGLIYACSYADFQSIDKTKYEIVGITGNSMGWYTALACSGALSANDGFTVVNKMGSIMHDHAVGGQILYPFVNENWSNDKASFHKLATLANKIEDLDISIYLGGMLVFAGSDLALALLEKELPAIGRFPMRLTNHAAFHSKLQQPNSERGKLALPESLFSQPKIPLIDGRGHCWLSGGVNIEDLWDYTFGHQITNTYDFTQAIINSMKEFCPDTLIILGPGTTLGGATAQSLLKVEWLGMNSKCAFVQRQKTKPIIQAMGLESQRSNVV